MASFDPHCCFCKKRYFSSSYRISKLSEIDKINYFRGNQHCVRCSNSFKDRERQINGFSTVPQFYHLSIDNDLLPRFLQMLDDLQKYSLAIFSEKIAQLIEFQPFMIAENMKIDSGNFYVANLDKNILVTGTFEMRNIHLTIPLTKTVYDKFETLLYSKKLIMCPQSVTLFNLQISSAIFYQLISPKTTVINCTKVEFTTTVRFSDFLQRTAELETFALESTNILFDNLWTKTVYNHSRTLREFSIPLKSLNLSRNSTAITKSSDDKTKCYLDFNKIDKEVAQRLSKYRIENKEDNMHASKIV